jgi:gliding-associated putative ABC transporter substrate-binding component GldG
LESFLTYASLERIAADQYGHAKRQTARLEEMGAEITLAIGTNIENALREMPNLMGAAVSNAIEPLTQRIENMADNVGNQNADALQNMVNQFRDQIQGAGEQTMNQVITQLDSLSTTLNQTVGALAQSNNEIRSSLQEVMGNLNTTSQNFGTSVQASANAAEALFEYKFIQAIYLLNRKTVPTIAYLIGNGEPVNLTVNDIGETLKDQYDLSVFDLSKGFPDATKIKTLLIVKPTTPFSDLDKLKIDQYVMGGGNIIWAIDKLYAEYDSLQKTDGAYVSFDRGLALDDLLFKYGIRINSNLIQDLNCAKLPLVVGTQGDGSPLIKRVPWPYYPFLNGNDNHPVSQNMDRVLSLFPSSIDTIASMGIKHTILLTTDTSSRSLPLPAQVSLNSVKGEEDMVQFKQHHFPVAVLSEGNFNSLFANRLSQVLKDTVQQNLGIAFASKGKSSKQIFISDADLFTNKVDKSNGPLPMGMIPFESYQFANRDFFVNSIQLLYEPIGLIESRNKGIVLRLLDNTKVAENRLFWQCVLLIGPFVILSLFFYFWTQYRQRRFGAM